MNRLDRELAQIVADYRDSQDPRVRWTVLPATTSPAREPAPDPDLARLYKPTKEGPR